MKKLRHREVKQFAQGHTARQGWAGCTWEVCQSRFLLSNPQSPNRKSLREEGEAQKSVTSTCSSDEYEAKLDPLSPGPLKHSIPEMHFMTT